MLWGCKTGVNYTLMQLVSTTGDKIVKEKIPDHLDPLRWWKLVEEEENVEVSFSEIHQFCCQTLLCLFNVSDHFLGYPSAYIICLPNRCTQSLPPFNLHPLLLKPHLFLLRFLSRTGWWTGGLSGLLFVQGQRGELIHHAKSNPMKSLLLVQIVD